ncbi:MAG: hypothetical protein JWN34_3075 [Bryobacterales bacterium]|nr:hypothetical protein [Bryobacterales bacterium]
MRATALLLFLLSALARDSIAQTANSVEADDPRPMMALIDKIQSARRVCINYEDPPFQNSRDVEDVTSLVVRDQTRDPSRRVVIPRGGKIQIDAALFSNASGPGGLLPVLREANMAYQKRGYPGAFRLEQKAGVWHVEPSGIKGPDGSAKSIGPVMNAKVRLSGAKSPTAEVLQSVLDQAAQQAGTKILIGSLPLQAFVNAATKMSADDESASVVLARLLASTSVGQSASCWSYRLLYDPGLKLYVFHLQLVTGSASVR